MKAQALGVIHDLRQRRLLPVALLLVVAILAVPVLLRQSSDPAASSAESQPVSDQTPGGLPSPESALNGAEKPLVTLAVLKDSSNLEEFKSKNPFKPAGRVTTATGATPTSGTLAGTGGGAQGGGTSSSGGDIPSSSGGGGGGDSTTPPTSTTPTTTTPSPTTTDGNTTDDKAFTYAVDATLKGPSREVSYRDVPKLETLPNADNPRLIFLGVDSGGKSAVFLVDSTLSVVKGEGSCSPSAQVCGTLKIQPGEVEVFQDQQGNRYTLTIDQIRQVSVADARRAAKRRERKAKAGAAHASAAHGSKPRRFTLPVLTDLFSRGAR